MSEFWSTPGMGWVLSLAFWYLILGAIFGYALGRRHGKKAGIREGYDLARRQSLAGLTFTFFDSSQFYRCVKKAAGNLALKTISKVTRG